MSSKLTMFTIFSRLKIISRFRRVSKISRIGSIPWELIITFLVSGDSIRIESCMIDQYGYESYL